MLFSIAIENHKHLASEFELIGKILKLFINNSLNCKKSKYILDKNARYRLVLLSSYLYLNPLFCGLQPFPLIGFPYRVFYRNSVNSSLFSLSRTLGRFRIIVLG